jgi:hypothetical protein
MTLGLLNYVESPKGKIYICLKREREFALKERRK